MLNLDRQQSIAKRPAKNRKLQRRYQVALAIFLFSSGALFSTARASLPTVGDHGTPVYLQPESRYPSGFYKKDWLETRTQEAGQIRLQRWFRVKAGQQFGWIAEDHALTALKLSSIARLIRNEPDRSAPLLDSLRKTTLLKGSQVIILEARGSWSRVRVLGKNLANHDSWILNEALKRDTGNQIEKGLVFQASSLYALPKKSSRKIASYDPGEVISITRSTYSEKATWLEIQLESSAGWIERRNVWLAMDLADNSIRSLIPGLELRSSPYPNSNLVRSLAMSEKLKVLSSQYLRWIPTSIPQQGKMWWPLSDSFSNESESIPPMKIITTDLLSRGLFDMTVAKNNKDLRFASAGGVFKSNNGRDWSQIPFFENKNYPIATATNGWIFVGPYLSTDQGTSFHQWIKWDTLVEHVKRLTGSSLSRVRISSITANPNLQSLGKTSDEIQLELDLGVKKPLLIATDDLGKSWKLIKKN